MLRITLKDGRVAEYPEANGIGVELPLGSIVPLTDENKGVLDSLDNPVLVPIRIEEDGSVEVVPGRLV